MTKVRRNNSPKKGKGKGKGAASVSTLHSALESESMLAIPPHEIVAQCHPPQSGNLGEAARAFWEGQESNDEPTYFWVVPPSDWHSYVAWMLDSDARWQEDATTWEDPPDWAQQTVLVHTSHEAAAEQGLKAVLICARVELIVAYQTQQGLPNTYLTRQAALDAIAQGRK